MAVQLHSFAADSELAHAAARAFLDWLGRRSRPGRRPAVALAGGRITGTFYDALVAAADGPERELLRSAEYFWGDERCVPPGSADSNYRLAKDRLFDPVDVPAGRQHRIRGELPPEEACRRFADELGQFAPGSPGGQPQIDLVLLGMGEDGHVASLFPGAPDEAVRSTAACLPVIGPKPPPQRITLSYPALGAAAEVWVLVAGAGKLAPLQAALAGDGGHGLGRVLTLRADTRIFESVGAGSR